MKSNNKELAAKILLMLALGLYHSMPVAYALPSQGTLDNSKAATITTSKNMMNIVGKGKNNILNWANFQIGKGETVKFNDKNNYLNLVHGVDISRIYGTISGGDTVYLVNPNGILFGQGARLDNVGNFVASTRNISSIDKEAFLQEPGNVPVVLGTDNPIMDNKDYYPEDSSYIPKISVAEMQLTNVPASATNIILDGPGGVILKNTELLDQTMQVTTRKNGGEIGIGSDNGTVVLTKAQKEKIVLLDGDKAYTYNDNAKVLQGYQTIQNMDEFIAMDTVVRGEKAKNYMLVSDIDASGINGYKTINGKGIFEGMGYCLSNFEVTEPSVFGTYKFKGVFGRYEGDIRNVCVENVSFSNLKECDYIGGLVGELRGNSNISNVYVSGSIDGTIPVFVYPTKTDIGGIIGAGASISEIRNCGSNVSMEIKGDVKVPAHPYYVGGIVGRINYYHTESATMLCNVFNTGDISFDVEQHWVHLGGIIGGTGEGNCELELKNAYNFGNLFSTHGSSRAYVEQTIIGGVIGSVWEDAKVSVGDVYNFGSLDQAVKKWGDMNYLHTGGIIGRVYYNNIVNTIVDMHGKTLKSYYIQNDGNCTYNTNFGEEKTSIEMLNLFNKDMIGVHDFSSTNGAVTSGVPDTGEITPPINPEPEIPNVPVDPETDKPDAPSVNPDNPVEPKPELPSVEPETNLPQEPSMTDKEEILKDIIGEKEYQEIVADIINIDKDQESYWKERVDSINSKNIYDGVTITEFGSEFKQNFEYAKRNNALITYNGKEYVSDFGTSYNYYDGPWIKKDETTLIEVKFNLFDGLSNAGAPEEDWCENKKTALVPLANWGMDFLVGAFDSIHLKVEMYELGEMRRLILKVKSGKSTTAMQVGQKITLGGTQTPDLMRFSDQIKRQYPELDQNKFYSGTGYISEAYLDNPYDYYIEIDKNFNAKLKPIIPEGSSFVITSFPPGECIDFTGDLANQEIPLSTVVTIEIMDMLDKAGFHFGEYNSLRQEMLNTVQQAGGRIPQSSLGQDISR